MLHTHITLWYSIIFVSLLPLVLANPQNDGSYGFTIDPNDSISFSDYNGYFNLRPCLRDMFGNNGATVNQIAENVDCLTNNCLCDQEKISANNDQISSQVPSRCTDIRAGDIPMATSVLSGYCGGMGEPRMATDPSTTGGTPAESSTEPSFTESPNDKIYTTSKPTTLETRVSTTPTPKAPTATTKLRGSPSTSTTIPSTTPGDKDGTEDSKAKEPLLSKEAIVGICSGALTFLGLLVAIWMCCCGPCSRRT